MGRGFIFTFLLFMGQILAAQSIIPFPSKGFLSERKFDLRNIQSICVEDKILEADAQVFNHMVSLFDSGKQFELSKNKQHAILLTYDKKAADEAYTIDMLYDNSIRISGKPDGVFYGLMSVLQCMYTPAQTINKMEDAPAFKWRGMHLDVSRHFFDVSFIKKYLDMMALYKMNTFHWHLTDDQGWRIEIKQFPLLTSIGSKRKETMVEKHFNPYVGDGKEVKGFYTQEEIKEIVAYAADRHITIVPEIEMPGHSLAMLSAYPELSCNKQPLEVGTTWGVFDDVLCCNDSNIHFMEKILDEVLTLFPSTFIHIGGDEVPKTRWKTCKVCQGTMHIHGLRDENELQSYFVKQIDAYLTAKGRNTIGWDEILEGGIAPGAAIMSWRGEEGGIAAAKQNHQVVMTPGGYCYFDHYQGNKQTEPLAIGGYTTVEKVYSYNPIPKDLPLTQQKYILGAQGNVWTEYIPTSQHVEYMILPRMCALSEVLWTGKSKPGYLEFVQRLEDHFLLLKKADIHFSRAIYDVSLEHEATGGYIFAKANMPFQHGSIRYTTDGEDPTFNSREYNNRIFISSTCTLKAQYFEGDQPMGNIAVKDFRLHKGVNCIITSNIQLTRNRLNVLVDALVARQPKILDEYACWEEAFPSVTLDLHRPTQVNSIAVFALKEVEANNDLPTEITLSYSSDGKSYSTLKTLTAADINASYKLKGDHIRIPAEIKARYFKLDFKNDRKSSPSDPKTWLLISEIAVE